MKALACVDMGNSNCGILEGFRSAGLEIDEICLKELDDGTWTEKGYLFVFTVSFSPEVSAICQKSLVPYLSYIVQWPDELLYHPSVANPCNFIFCFDRAVCQRLQKVVPDRFFHLPLGVHTEWFSENGGEREKTEVSFVGSLCQTNDVFDKVEGLTEYAQGYLEALIKTQVRIYGENLLEAALTKDIIKELTSCLPSEKFPSESMSGMEYSFVVESILGNKVTEIERQQLLKAVSEQFETHLYTADVVDQLPDVCAHEPASSWEERAEIYRNSRINLHFTHRCVSSGVPQEVFEIMASGGFVLTNFQPEIPENFVIGEHLETFVNERELLEKISYYLEHEEERERIACAGQQAVREYHLYRERAIAIFNTVFSDHA